MDEHNTADWERTLNAVLYAARRYSARHSEAPELHPADLSAAGSDQDEIETAIEELIHRGLLARGQIAGEFAVTQFGWHALDAADSHNAAHQGVGHHASSVKIDDMVRWLKHLLDGHTL
jgi:hypothetical protein